MVAEAETCLEMPQGRFTLHRWPRRKREALRAWDAADEYLLTTLHERSLPAGARVLVVNDSFGALAVALHAWHPLSLSDSWLCHESTRQNLQANDLDPHSVTLLDALSTPTQILDVVLIKVPRTLALLEDELIRLAPFVGEETLVLVAGMVKAMPSSVWSMLERLLGPCTTGLARKKSKLIQVTPRLQKEAGRSPYPVCYPLEGSSFHLCNHANVFSRDGLDIGTRFFLQHLPEDVGEGTIIDLGCGNGVVGLVAAEKNPHAQLCFIDESFMAVASARDNFISNMGADREAQFLPGDTLSGVPDKSADVILCNPPFHQGTVVGDHIARRMFRQAKRVLRQGGELRVVGNRHLGYHKSLKKIFGNCELLDGNNKFVILRATA